MRTLDPQLAPKAVNDLGHLASGVGHHVINAFSAIVSNAELLRIKASSNRAPIDPAAIADLLIDTAVEASTVARRLIDYTRPVTSIGEDQVTLDQLVDEYVNSARQAETGPVVWSSRIEAVPPIVGSAAQIRSIIDRIVENSLEAKRPDSEVSLSLSTSLDYRGWVMLEIRDNGQGMEPEVMERAIEPFFTTKGGRSGVGLSIANGIWRRHKGTLSLKSSPGEGTLLRLCVEPSPL